LEGTFFTRGKRGEIASGRDLSQKPAEKGGKGVFLESSGDWTERTNLLLIRGRKGRRDFSLGERKNHGELYPNGRGRAHTLLSNKCRRSADLKTMWRATGEEKKRGRACPRMLRGTWQAGGSIPERDYGAVLRVREGKGALYVGDGQG